MQDSHFLCLRVWPARLPSVVKMESELYVCTQHVSTFHTHTHISVSGVDSRSLWGIGPEWHTHLVCYPVGHCPISETKHQTPCKPCRTCAWNQMWYNLHLRATLFHNYTIEQQGVCLHWRLLVNNDLLVFEGRICKQNSPHTHSTTHTYETSLLADWLILQAR